MRNYFSLFVILVTLNFIVPGFCFASDTSNQIIGTVNGENIYLNDFNRLYNAEKKKQEKITKEKLLGLIVDERLILQEAKKRNIQISENAVSARLDQIKQKLGEEGFKKFLLENNATPADAKNEIKNQLLYIIVTKQIPDLHSFLLQKRSSSKIILYKEKTSQKILIPNMEELIKTEKRRNYITSELSKYAKTFSQNLESSYAAQILRPLNSANNSQAFSPGLYNLNVFKNPPSNIPGIQTQENSTSEIKELIKRIEQRKITKRSNE